MSPQYLSRLSGVVLALVCSHLFVVTAWANPPGARTPQKARLHSEISSHQLVAPLEAGGLERGAPYSIELDVDRVAPDATTSIFTFGFNSIAKVAFGNRFTITSAQGPFRLEAVGAAFVRLMDGTGFEVGESARILVFVDAAQTGDMANATIASDFTVTLAQANAFVVHELPTPVVVRQGDVYIIVADVTTDDDDTPVPMTQFEDGGSSDPRALFSSSFETPLNPLAISAYRPLTDTGLVGNVVVRGYGEPATAGDLVTGAGESVSASLPEPTGLTAAGAGSVSLQWTPPALPPPPAPTPVAEVEPNNGPGAPQVVGTAVTVSGASQSSHVGSPGGFGTDDIEDWYQVTLPETTGLTVDLSGFGATDFDLFVYPAAGPFTAENAISYSAQAAGNDESIQIGALSPGTYLVGVSAYDPDVVSLTSYTLDIVASQRVVRYNVYSGATSGFPASAATYVGSAPGDATGFLVLEGAPGAYYRVSAVIGVSQSDPTAAATSPATTALDTIGIQPDGSSAWFLRNANAGGNADLVFTYAAGPYVAFTGDWDADGVSTPGVYFQDSGTFFLRNSNTPGPADVVFGYGPSGGFEWIPLAGDWNGDGLETTGLYDPVSGTFFLRNSNSVGAADLTFAFGAGGQGAVPIAGDWNGDLVDTIGIYFPSSGVFFLRNANTPGLADLTFSFGAGGAGFVPLAGDWNGDGVDTIGLYQPSTAAFFLRNANAGGNADAVFQYGATGATPVVGNWDGK
jgi:hypothetical protein